MLQLMSQSTQSPESAAAVEIEAVEVAAVFAAISFTVNTVVRSRQQQ